LRFPKSVSAWSADRFRPLRILGSLYPPQAALTNDSANSTIPAYLFNVALLGVPEICFGLVHRQISTAAHP
jgi:hypothetical protein